MSRSFADVLAEVTAQSDPQRQIVLKQIADLPTQQAADETALGAKKDQAYQDILDGARRRGLGFAGIPLGEQAKYNATDYAPTVANLKSTYAGKGTTLESALAGIGSNNYATANDIFDRERNFEEQQRQFNESLAEQKRQSATQNSSLANLFNENKPAPPAAPDPYAQIDKQGATNALVGLFKTNNVGTISKTINAIKASAARGNAYDKYKLELLAMYQKNSPYGGLISKSLNYKPTATTPPSAPKAPAPIQSAYGPISALKISNPLAIRR